MKRLVVLVMISVSVLVAGCTNSNKAQRVLEANGYTQIQYTGYRFFMKSDNETFSTGFRAKSPSGKIVTGAVTSGWIGGGTIRLD